MNIDHPELQAVSSATPASPEVFQQLGALTRVLHDTLEQLGVMPRLQDATEQLPDARSRLNYIASKTAAAADKVLNSVDQAKTEHGNITQQTRALAQVLAADPVRAVASGAVWNFVTDVEASTARIDAHLTDIMLAQDFHDLTGQVMSRVVALAGELEDALVKVLLAAAPPQQVHKLQLGKPALQGPVVNNVGAPEVVANQGEVDDLLASLGF